MMNVCVIDDCLSIGHCFGGLCSRHYRYRVQDDPSFDPGSESVEAKEAREKAWLSYCRIEAAQKTQQILRALGTSLLHDAPLIGRILWHSRRLGARYPEGDERRPLYRTLLQVTHDLGQQIYELPGEGEGAAAVELFRPPHRESTPYTDVFQRITHITGWRRGPHGVSVSACKWIQKVVNYLLSENVLSRDRLLAIGRTAYRLATLTRTFQQLCDEIGMRAVHAIILRQIATNILPSAALRTFGSDAQNIHTPVATGPTEQALVIIMAWPSIPSTSLYFPLSMITTLIGTPSTSIIGSNVWGELIHDMSHCVSFGQSYGSVLNHVITKIHTYPAVTQTELFQRLTEEILEGSGLCVQGKMTRLANVLRGFDPEIDACVSFRPSREEFQNRFVVITKSGLPIPMQKELGRQLLEECLIPEGEREGWLTALEE